MAIIVLTKGTGPVMGPQEPLTWRPVSRSNGPVTATVTCSNNHEGLIGEHEISAEGTVTPSVVCTFDKCGWHEYIRLGGWEGLPTAVV